MATAPGSSAVVSRCTLAPPGTLPLTVSPTLDEVDRLERPLAGTRHVEHQVRVAHVDEQGAGDGAALPFGRVALDPGDAHRHGQRCG